MEARRTSKRVEQRGRFTITEIIPGSPLSPPAPPAFVQVQQAVGAGSEVEAAGASPPDQVLVSPEAAVALAQASDASAPAVIAVDEYKESLPPSAEAVVKAVEEASAPVSAEMPVAGATAAVAAAAAAAVAPMEPSSQEDSSPEREIQYKRLADRRVKRKGRFTIIELASDSPTSRKQSDEFETTVSAAPARPMSSPARFSRSFTASATATKQPTEKHHRVARSMTRFHEPHSARRSRLRSESPVRHFKALNGSGRQVLDSFQSTAYDAQIPLLQRNGSATSISTAPATTRVPSEPSLASLLPAHEGAPLPTGVTAQPSLSSSAIRTGSALSSATLSHSLLQTTESEAPRVLQQQPAEPPSVDRLHAAALQHTITISAAQFLQQQQTIASLIRQQHDLKQIIAVLQEQQQQLMTIPVQLNELKRESTNSDGKDEETKELYVQVDALNRTNESMQSLLHQAEQDLNLRSLEIECLSEENDELRRRCALLESRYISEKKQSFILEEELQRLRMMTLNHELHERLTSSQVNAEQP